MTFSTDALAQILQTYGLWLLFPLAVVEGPIVTVIAGWLARLGMLPLVPTALVLIFADLVGDVLLYSLGRSGLGMLPHRWRDRMGLRPDRLADLAAHFDTKGGRTLILAKLTHSLGFAALVTAGAARMPVVPCLWFNLVGTIPKTAALLAIGYAVGEAHVAINTWIGWGSVLIGIAGIGLLIGWLTQRKWRRS
jgi:membrane-associated protein